MRRYFFLLFSIIALTIQAQTRYVGYTTNDDIDVSGGAFGQAGTYTIGVKMGPQMLSAYEGCRIVGLRVAAAMNLGRTRTFIYKVDGSTLTPVIEQRQRLYEGWNEVLWNGNGHVIEATETLFFGFDYEETVEMVSAEEGGLCGAGHDTDGAFYLYGDYGSSTGFYPITGIGCLCVQLIVDISSLPLYDLDMTYLDAGFKYKQPGDSIDVLASFANVGRAVLTQFQLGYQIDDGQPVYENVTDTLLREGRTDSWLFTCHLPDDIAIGIHRLKVYVTQAEGQPMADRSKNDTLKADFAIYRQSLQRQKAYLEVYTDQTSPYVPYLNDALTLLDGDERLCLVNVHRPGTPLAISEAAYLHDLYAYDWPTFTINRSYFPGEAYISYDMNDYLPAIPASMSAAIIGDMVMQDYASPSFANIDLQATYDETTRRLSVTTTGQLLPEANAIYGDLALTLMLVENSVKNSQVIYNTITQRTTTNRNYVHQHVLRGYLTAPMGDGLTATDVDYMATHSMIIPEGWSLEQLTLVALLTKQVPQVTDDNARDVDVINAHTLALSSLKNGDGLVTVPSNSPAQSASFFSLDGKPVDRSSLHHGIYLLRQSDGHVRKMMVK